MKTNRDLSIERLLRRSLQTQGPPSGDCPDVEALASLADDTLSAAERQIVEAHVADCHRCQALTAALLRTMPANPTIPQGAGDDRAASPWWKRRGTLNWLVPATAAATAVALWVAVPGQRTPAPEERQTEVQTAAAPPPAPPDASAVDTFRSRSDRPADNRSRANEAGSAIGSTTPAAAPSPAPPQSSLKQDEDRLRRQEGVASEKVSAAPEPDRSFQDRTAALAARAAAPAAVAGFEVVSSDPLIRWRVGPGVVVQYSADGGSTWTTQETGAPAPLTAGTSPSPSVCWLVGRAGAVLRTLNGGRQWQRVAFPEAADLIAVAASNALTATVDLADGRRLSTTDGGQTWTPVPK